MLYYYMERLLSMQGLHLSPYAHPNPLPACVLIVLKHLNVSALLASTNSQVPQTMHILLTRTRAMV